MGTLAKLFLGVVIVLIIMSIFIQFTYKGGLTQLWKDLSSQPNKPRPSIPDKHIPDKVVPKPDRPRPQPEVDIAGDIAEPGSGSGQELAPTPVPEIPVPEVPSQQEIIPVPMPEIKVEDILPNRGQGLLPVQDIVVPIPAPSPEVPSSQELNPAISADTLFPSGGLIPQNMKQPIHMFVAHHGKDRPGNNIIKWDDARNFGDTGGAKNANQCAIRCLATDHCRGFGWDPTIKGGYCTIKSSIGPSLQNWNSTGTFYDRI